MKKILLIFVILLAFTAVACESKKKDEKPIVTRLFPIENLDSLKEMYPNKVIVATFYNSTNKNSRKQIVALIEAYESNKDKDFVVVGLSTDLTEDDAIKFINEERITFPTFLAPKSLQRNYKVSKVPTSYVYAKDGRLLVIKDGILTPKYLKNTANTEAR